MPCVCVKAAWENLSRISVYEPPYDERELHCDYGWHTFTSYHKENRNREEMLLNFISGIHRAVP